MICKKCGYQNTPAAKYCSGCGKKLEAPRKPPAAQNWLILAVAICVIIIGLLAGYIHFGKKEKAVEDVPAKPTYTAQTRHVHTWKEATYNSPKTCTSCGAAEGEPLRDPSENILMADSFPAAPDEFTSYDDYPAFGGSVTREEIRSIQFLDSTEGAPMSSWDVSQARNNAVLAWVEPAADDTYTLFIAADGGVYAPKDCSYLFAEYDNLCEIAFNNAFHTGSARTMEGMFYGCGMLYTADLNTLDTSKVTDMSRMFYWTGFQTLDLSGLDVSNVTDMAEMFYGCRYLTSLNVQSWDTSKVARMRRLFCDCRSLTRLDIRTWDTSQVTDMSNMFGYCWSLAELDVRNLDTSSVRDMDSMFWRCATLTELDLSGFDTSNVMDMSLMFKECASLKTIKLGSFDTSHVQSMAGMFQMCESLESLDLSSFDTSAVTNMAGMFGGCSSLTKLDIRHFDMSRVESTASMFEYDSIIDLKLPAGWTLE